MDRSFEHKVPIYAVKPYPVISEWHNDPKDPLYTDIGVRTYKYSSNRSFFDRLKTKLIRIKPADGSTAYLFTITLDGSTPNAANTSALQMSREDLEGSTGPTAHSSLYLPDIAVEGGETFKIAYNDAGYTWADESGTGNSTLVLEQYSY